MLLIDPIPLTLTQRRLCLLYSALLLYCIEFPRGVWDYPKSTWGHPKGKRCQIYQVLAPEIPKVNRSPRGLMVMRPISGVICRVAWTVRRLGKRPFQIARRAVDEEAFVGNGVRHPKAWSHLQRSDTMHRRGTFLDIASWSAGAIGWTTQRRDKLRYQRGDQSSETGSVGSFCSNLQKCCNVGWRPNKWEYS